MNIQVCEEHKHKTQEWLLCNQCKKKPKVLFGLCETCYEKVYGKDTKNLEKEKK